MPGYLYIMANTNAPIQEFTHAQQELVRTAKNLAACSPDAQTVAQAQQELKAMQTQAEAALRGSSKN